MSVMLVLGIDLFSQIFYLCSAAALPRSHATGVTVVDVLCDE